jgi:transaldolase/glucose-6-phosphate isomerase
LNEEVVMKPIEQLKRVPQSLWLDYIRRGMLTSGTLQRYLKDFNLRGLTSNPTIFDHAIAESSDYDDAISRYDPFSGQSIEELFFSLAVEDLQDAADCFRPIYEQCQGTDGFVSLEVSPRLANDTAGTIRQAEHLWQAVDRPNLLIKVPGTEAGIQALETLIAKGINVNVTLLFSAVQYRAAAKAFWAGLEKRLERNLSLNIASVASLFISRWDVYATAHEPRLERNQLGLAVARQTYSVYEELYGSSGWKRLATAGAHPQRLLWASTGAKDPSLSATYYVDRLLAPHSINTVPEATLLAFAAAGQPQDFLSMGSAEKTLAQARDLGIDLEQWARTLQLEGQQAFVQSFDNLTERLRQKTKALGQARTTSSLPHYEGPLGKTLSEKLTSLQNEKLVERFWKRDYRIWQPQPDEITNRMGWLDTPRYMQDHATRLEHFAAELVRSGIREILWCGMGGSSLFARVVEQAWPTAKGVRIEVLDTSHPVTLKRVLDRYQPGKSLVVIASKSGKTLETRSQLELFWARDPDGSHYLAITDPGTELEKLALSRGFRALFRNDPTIGGRYSALSYFGLVALAFKGVSLQAWLHSAEAMATACAPCVPAHENPGLVLGTMLGLEAQAGRDKCTLILPPTVSRFGGWLEQLLAESTGKHNHGIIPIQGEPLTQARNYGSDRLFVTLDTLSEGWKALDQADQAQVVLPELKPERLGAEVFRWEFATAVAGHLLGLNPFDQPDVESAKQAAGLRLCGKSPTAAPPLDSPAKAFGSIRPGDYLAFQAYIDLDSPYRSQLEDLRLRLRDRYQVATQLEFGPRYLHSTGQLHKGGPQSGVFIQFLDDFKETLPIPGQAYGFGELIRAQADGDYEALKTRNRRVFRVRLLDLLNYEGS